MGFGFAVQLAGGPRTGTFLQRPQVFLDKALAGPFDGGDTRLQGLGNLVIRQPLIGFE